MAPATLDPEPHKVWYTAGAPNLANFPDTHQFGNGVTIGAKVKINGTIQTLRWVCFPIGAVLTTVQKATLNKIMKSES